MKYSDYNHAARRFYAAFINKKNLFLIKRKMGKYRVFTQYESPGIEDNVRFGFFGELGYGLIGWLPYLKFISETVGPIQTAGLEGSTAFFNFSAHHIEIPVQQAACWGNRKTALYAKNFLHKCEKLVVPVMEKNRFVSVGGYRWLSNNIHVPIDPSHYSPLSLKEIAHPNMLSLPSDFVVINIKNHFNWGHIHTPNFYIAREIRQICDWAYSKGMRVLINRFPANSEPDQIYVDVDLKISDLGGHVLDLAPMYAKLDDLRDKNDFQISCLNRAHHVFSSQGGNAVLALLCAKDVTILMREGSDYVDYIHLSSFYKTKMEVIYELSHSFVLRQ